MEAVLGLIGAFLVMVVINLLIRGAVGTVSAAGRTVFGKGSFSENMELQFRGMGPFQIRATLVRKGTDDAPFDYYKIEGKGLIPTTHPRQIKFATSILDTTGDQKKPVWSVVDDFQEPKTIAYRHEVGGGAVAPNQGFVSWVRVGVVIPEMLVPPRGGDRQLLIVVRILDTGVESSIELGFHDKDDPSMVGAYSTTVRHHFALKGYEEAAEQRDQVNAMAVRLAVAVAMADGDMAEEEGATISRWIQKVLSPLGGERREALKKACNAALTSAYEDAKNGTLSLSGVTEQINEMGDDTLKYQAIELCLDVMAADGVASAAELDVIRKIALALELDFDELQKLKDQRLVSIKASASDDESMEHLLGIDPSWSTDQIKKHLRAEFAKWNGRLNNLQDQEERDNTQRMLNLIAEARRKYG